MAPSMCGGRNLVSPLKAMGLLISPHHITRPLRGTLAIAEASSRFPCCWPSSLRAMSTSDIHRATGLYGCVHSWWKPPPQPMITCLVRKIVLRDLGKISSFDCILLESQTLQNLQTSGTTAAFPSDGWHACSRRCQLALDLTVRGTGYTYTPLHSLGDCNVVGVVLFVVFMIVAFEENILIFPATLPISLRRMTITTTCGSFGASYHSSCFRTHGWSIR